MHFCSLLMLSATMARISKGLKNTDQIRKLSNQVTELKTVLKDMYEIATRLTDQEPSKPAEEDPECHPQDPPEPMATQFPDPVEKEKEDPMPDETSHPRDNTPKTTPDEKRQPNGMEHCSPSSIPSSSV